MATLGDMAMSPSLLGIHARIKHGLAELADAHTPVFEFPETRIQAGVDVVLSLNMPFDGYVRLIANERGNFFPLNCKANLPTDRVSEGLLTTRHFSTSSHVSRTLFIALASTDDVFSSWPSGAEETAAMNDGSVLQLLQPFELQNSADRALSVQSMLTHI